MRILKNGYGSDDDTETIVVMDCQKHLFSLPDDVAYLNVAYQCPFLKTVEEIGIQSLRKKNFPIHITRESFFDPPQELKGAFSKLINAQDPERVAILASASYGLSTVAKNVPLEKGQNVVLIDEQFPSNYYPWKRCADECEAELREVASPIQSQGRGQAWNEAFLAAIDENTAAVSMPHVHWADGTKFDLKAIGEKCRSVGALFIIDGTQSIGALPFDLQEIQADAVICAGYKWLFGPYAIAVGYFGPRFDGGVPIEENWINRKDSDQFEKLVSYQAAYQPKAARYNVGESSNFIMVPMLTTSINQLMDWGVENIQNYCQALQEPFLEELTALGCTLEDPEYRSYHLFGIRLPGGVDVIKLKDDLAARNVFVSIRGDSVRVAPHVYNESKDFEMLVEALRANL